MGDCNPCEGRSRFSHRARSASGSVRASRARRHGDQTWDRCDAHAGRSTGLGRGAAAGGSAGARPTNTTRKSGWLMIATKAIPFFAKERAMSKRSFHASTLCARVAIGLVSLVLLGAATMMSARADIKIGFQAPLTGPSATDGKSAQIAAQMAVEDINSAGG